MWESGNEKTENYKLYFNSENAIFGNSSGNNIYTGSRNIVIGSNAGPLSTDNSLSDKLYIDSDTRGVNSFIYGNMTRGSEELNINADGFNFGSNIGIAGGAGIVDHIHFHVVPRWKGDTNFMPVIGKTKVQVQALQETYDELKPTFDLLMKNK